MKQWKIEHWKKIEMETLNVFFGTWKFEKWKNWQFRKNGKTLFHKVLLSTWGNRWMFIYIHIHTLYIDLIRRWVCRYVRGDVDTSSLAGDTAFAYDTSSVNTHEKHDSPRSRNSDTSRKVKSTRALDKNLYVCNKIHLYQSSGRFHPSYKIEGEQLGAISPWWHLDLLHALTTLLKKGKPTLQVCIFSVIYRIL